MGSEPKVDRRVPDPWRDKMEDTITELKTEMVENTKITKAASEQVAVVHDTLVALDGALKVFKVIASIIKYVGMIATGLVAAVVGWKFFTGGNVTHIDLPK